MRFLLSNTAAVRNCARPLAPLLPMLLLDMDHTMMVAVRHPVDEAHNVVPSTATVTEEGLLVFDNVPWVHGNGSGVAACSGDGAHPVPRSFAHIVLRPHVLTFIAALTQVEGQGQPHPLSPLSREEGLCPAVTPFRWKLCTANHPINAIAFLWRLLSVINMMPHHPALWSSATPHLPPLRVALQRPSDRILAHYAAQHVCLATFNGPNRTPRKQLRRLMCPSAPASDDAAQHGREEASHNNGATVVGGGGVSPAEAAMEMQWSPQSMADALLVDDNARVLDVDDFVLRKQCALVPPFGNSIRGLSRAKEAGMCGGDAPLPTMTAWRLDGATEADVCDAWFSTDGTLLPLVQAFGARRLSGSLAPSERWPFRHAPQRIEPYDSMWERHHASIGFDQEEAEALLDNRGDVMPMN